MFRPVLLFTIALLSCSSLVMGQPRKPIGRAPSGEAAAGRTAMATTTLSIPDSAAFIAAFNSLWPLVQPEITVRERVEKRFHRTWKNLNARGVDTAVAHDSLLANIDTMIEYTLVRAAFVRSKFTPEDLRALSTFYKSPVGRKYLDAQSAIADARSSEIDRYVQRLYNSVVIPMMKPKEPARAMSLPGQDSTALPPVPAPLDTLTHK